VEQERNPIPTPYVSCIVVWYRNGRVSDDDACPAIVTRRDGVGVVSLTVFPPLGTPVVKSAVMWAQHPDLPKDERLRQHNGIWDYPEGSRVRRGDFDYHHEVIAKQKAMLAKDRQRIEEMMYHMSLRDDPAAGREEQSLVQATGASS
jgi:hypothetical protein